jgi:hypothetical protein
MNKTHLYIDRKLQVITIEPGVLSQEYAAGNTVVLPK